MDASFRGFLWLPFVRSVRVLYYTSHRLSVDHPKSLQTRRLCIHQDFRKLVESFCPEILLSFPSLIARAAPNNAMLRTTPRVLAFNKRRNRILQWMLMICAWLTLFMAAQFQGVTASLPNGGDYSSSKATTSPSLFIRIPGNRYELLESDWSQDDRGYWMGGSGREYMLFDSRGGSSRKKHQDDDSDADDDDDTTKDRRAKELLTRFRRSRLASSPTTTSRNRFRWSTGGGLYGNRASPFDNGSSSSNNRIEFLDTVQTWWSANVIPTLEKMPKIVCRVGTYENK